MSNQLIAVDLGSKFVTVASNKAQYIVKEPAVVAVDAVDGKNVKAVGINAIKLYNNPLSKIKLVHPIENGAIIDRDYAVALLKTLIAKILPRATMFNKVVVYCVTPCGMNKSDKETIDFVFNAVGIKQIKFLTAPVACACEIFKQFNTSKGVICDIGCDKTDIAAVHSGNILAGCTIYNSGSAIDKAIAELILNKYGVQITLEEAERVKISCASLYPNDVSSVYAEGVNVQKGLLEQINITARELYDIVAGVAKRYCQLIEGLFMSVAPEAVGILKEEGVFICGGGANLSGIDKYMLDYLKLNVRIPFSPETVAINGAKLLIAQEK